MTQRKRTTWKITKSRPLRICGAVVLSSRETTLTIIGAKATVKRLRKADIQTEGENHYDAKTQKE